MGDCHALRLAMTGIFKTGDNNDRHKNPSRNTAFNGGRVFKMGSNTLNARQYPCAKGHENGAVGDVVEKGKHKMTTNKPTTTAQTAFNTNRSTA